MIHIMFMIGNVQIGKFVIDKNENFMSIESIIGVKLDKTYKLERFLAAQNYKGTYERALQEIKNGSRETHWIWFVFPQCYGLGYSKHSRRYGIKRSSEAKAYIRAIFPK